MNANEAFPSKYLKAGDIGESRPTVTIESVDMELIGQGDDQSNKPVIGFKGKDKKLVCNKTNWSTIMALHGSDTDDWNGKQITLCVMPVDFRGKTTLAIRVMPSLGKTAKPEPEGEIPF